MSESTRVEWRRDDPSRSGLYLVTRRMSVIGLICATASWNGREWFAGSERLRDVVAWAPMPEPWSENA